MMHFEKLREALKLLSRVQANTINPHTPQETRTAMISAVGMITFVSDQLEEEWQAEQKRIRKEEKIP